MLGKGGQERTFYLRAEPGQYWKIGLLIFKPSFSRLLDKHTSLKCRSIHLKSIQQLMWNLSHHPPFSYFSFYHTKIFPLQNDENDNFLFPYQHIDTSYSSHPLHPKVFSQMLFRRTHCHLMADYLKYGRTFGNTHLAFTRGLVVFSLCE